MLSYLLTLRKSLGGNKLTRERARRVRASWVSVGLEPATMREIYVEQVAFPLLLVKQAFDNELPSTHAAEYRY